jgi:hypothetical protein
VPDWARQTWSADWFSVSRRKCAWFNSLSWATAACLRPEPRGAARALRSALSSNVPRLAAPPGRTPSAGICSAFGRSSSASGAPRGSDAMAAIEPVRRPSPSRCKARAAPIGSIAMGLVLRSAVRNGGCPAAASPPWRDRRPERRRRAARHVGRSTWSFLQPLLDGRRGGMGELIEKRLRRMLIPYIEACQRRPVACRRGCE